MAAVTRDPLYVIFENHIFNSKKRNTSDFCTVVTGEYMNYLKYSGAIIPQKKERLIITEVMEEVNETLKAFISPHSSINEFLTKLEDIDYRKINATKKYFELY